MRNIDSEQRSATTSDEALTEMVHLRDIGYAWRLKCREIFVSKYVRCETVLYTNRL